MNRAAHNRGFTLLITLLLMSVLLGVSGSLLNVVLRQYQLSGISETSEMAFQAANAGMECLLYHDFLAYPVSKFDVNGAGGNVPEEANISCMGQTSSDIESSNNGTVASGEEQLFQFNWGTPALCTEVSVFKYSENSGNDGDTTGPDMSNSLGSARTCPEDSVCTVVKSRGYNTSCATITTTPRTVERELVQVY